MLGPVVIRLQADDHHRRRLPPLFT